MNTTKFIKHFFNDRMIGAVTPTSRFAIKHICKNMRFPRLGCYIDNVRTQSAILLLLEFFLYLQTAVFALPPGVFDSILGLHLAPLVIQCQVLLGSLVEGLFITGGLFLLYVFFEEDSRQTRSPDQYENQ